MTREQAVELAMYGLTMPRPLSPLNVWLCVLLAIVIVVALLHFQSENRPPRQF